MAKQIQLPKGNAEARRCVLIVIENHVGLITGIVTKANGYEYAIVEPYRPAKKSKKPKTGKLEI